MHNIVFNSLRTGESLTHNLYHDPRSVVNASDLNDGLAPTALDDQGAG